MQNDGTGHHAKYADEKTHNSADDNSVITYRKMSDKADDDNMNTKTKNTDTDDDLDEEIYLRTFVILILSNNQLAVILFSAFQLVKISETSKLP